MLTEHGCQIAPSTYYDARSRGPSVREQRDERWKQVIVATGKAQHRRYGARKLWLRLRRNGHDIARCTVEVERTASAMLANNTTYAPR